jgi:protein-S-isoprenylcysteine O-methyltransferase Ste14
MPSARSLPSTAFAGLAYLLFLAVFGYAVAFLAGVAVPRTVDAGGPHSGTASAILIDVLLLSLFAVQHSAMARPAFKRFWTRVVPPHVERSCYVLIASAVLALTFWQWRPLPHVVWHVHAVAPRVLLWTLYALGWVVVVAMTFAIDHFDLVGLEQVRRYRNGRAQATPEFRLPLPYRLVRHPMMTGFFLTFFAVPRMTAGHLLFALLSTAYIVVAVRLEERDLAGTLPEYRDYAAGTPRFVPRPGRQRYAPRDAAPAVGTQSGSG